MFQEIERKFLVKGDFAKEIFQTTEIKQGYLCRDNGITVRVRIKGDKGFLTIKGRRIGISRFEWEKEITVEEALALLEQTDSGCIEKTRHMVKNTDGRHIWEVDEFHGDNEGLVVAEIELADENEPFDIPEWVGDEVTDDSRYYNAQLLEKPYKNWK
ncbi:MAG: CYTH domain-containing protein [Bacteroidales bacterium]|nr:CYTH domain-containing protein [Bacteroidales bacterium]